MSGFTSPLLGGLIHPPSGRGSGPSPTQVKSQLESQQKRLDDTSPAARAKTVRAATRTCGLRRAFGHSLKSDPRYQKGCVENQIYSKSMCDMFLCICVCVM